MSKYLKLFDTHAEYQTYITGSDKVLPNVSYCEDNNDVHYNPWTWAEEYLTFVALEDGTFSCTGSVSYSLDNGETWIELTPNASTPTITTGSSIIWKNTAPVQYSVGSFNSTGEFDIKGNIMSLLYGDNFKGQTIIQNYSAFQNLFYIGNNNGCKIVNAKDLSLPATTLTTYCYAYMFYDCTSLVSVPKLPATTLADSCYSGMFQGCTSLVTAPELPATTLANYCYQRMFQGCTSLVTAPELPATTLADSCYSQMFDSCTALVNAPELSATTLAKGCYTAMFFGCTSLTTAPVLSAITLVNTCYYRMFNGCTSLNYIKAMFTTTPGTSYTINWLNNVASSGTFVKNSAAQWNVTGVNGIPSGWTVQIASE